MHPILPFSFLHSPAQKPIHRMASIVETDNEGGQTAIAAAAAGRGFPSQVLEDDNEGKDRSPAPPLAQ